MYKKLLDQITAVSRRCSKSTFLWVVSGLIASDIILTAVYPLQFIKNIDYMPLSQNPMVSKISKFLVGPEDPEVLVIGSSLPMFAISEVDDEYAHSVDSKTIHEVMKYTEARYLRDGLKRVLPKTMNKAALKDLKVYNLTIAGSMVSDTNLLLKKVCQENKHPQILLYGIGPRSFIDNSVSKEEKTTPWRILSKWRGLDELLNSNLNLDEKRDLLLSNFWNFYREKMDYQTFFLSYTCCKLNRSATIYAAQQRAAAKGADKQLIKVSEDKANQIMGDKYSRKFSTKGHQSPPALLRDLALYDMRYNPPDFKQFESQKSHLKEILAFCKSKGIKLLVIAMPITEQNKTLLDKQLYQRYSKEIPSLVLQNGSSFLNLDDNSIYGIADFRDSVHTNSRGGRKIQDRLVEAIKKNNWL